MAIPKVELLQHQIDFIFASDQYRYVGLKGGFRSGKSIGGWHRCIRMGKENLGYNGAIVLPTNSMLRRNVTGTKGYDGDFAKVLDQVGLPYEFRLTDPMEYTLDYGNGQARIYLLSAEAIERARGLALAWYHISEFDTMDSDLAHSVVDIMDSRITNGNLMQASFESTPEGFKEFYDMFEGDGSFYKDELGEITSARREDRLIITASTEDNPFITPDYVARLKARYDHKLVEAYLYGKFVNMTHGSVYYNFDRKLNHTDATVEDFPGLPLLIGQDFNVGFNSSVVYVINPETDCPMLLEDSGHLQDTETTIEWIKDTYPNRKIFMFPDSSGDKETSNASVSDIAMLKRAGFEVKVPVSKTNKTDINAKGKNPRVKDRIASVNCMLLNANGERRLTVNTKRARNATKTLEQQTYVNGKPDKDPTRALDHMGDALGYPISYNWPIDNEKIRNVARITN